MHAQLGVVVGLLSTSVQSVGLTLQRKSHLLEEEKEDDYDRRPPYKRRRWQLDPSGRVLTLTSPPIALGGDTRIQRLTWERVDDSGSDSGTGAA